jgi:hypothetical protein
MPFITREKITARELDRLAQIESLKDSVADKDTNPLVPGEQYMGGDMFDGFFAGMIVNKTSDYLAIWSKMARRVAILPMRGIEGIPDNLDVIVAIHSWGSRKVLRRCVVLTASYGWLDAFDDYIIAFQRSDRDYRMSLATDGLCGDIFALNERGQVATWYREREVYAARERKRQQYFRDQNDA